jgi:hypothetical protein
LENIAGMLNCIKKGAAERVTEVPIKETVGFGARGSNQFRRQALSD